MDSENWTDLAELGAARRALLLGRGGKETSAGSGSHGGVGGGGSKVTGAG